MASPVAAGTRVLRKGVGNLFQCSRGGPSSLSSCGVTRPELSGGSLSRPLSRASVAAGGGQLWPALDLCATGSSRAWGLPRWSRRTCRGDCLSLLACRRDGLSAGLTFPGGSGVPPWHGSPCEDCGPPARGGVPVGLSASVRALLREPSVAHWELRRRRHRRLL